MNLWSPRQKTLTNSHSDLWTSPIKIMGILNATPDSFSGDGRLDPAQLVDRGMAMIDQGADILDIGGESTQPFATAVDTDEEIRRVLPVIRGLHQQTEIPISIDTRHVRTAEIALDEGASIVNDVSGLGNSDMRQLIARTDASVIIMHMQGTPETMQSNPKYTDVVKEVAEFLRQRVDEAMADGISPQKIILDPGIGFGKTLEHNLKLIRNLEQLRVEDCPILLGASRKSMIGMMLGNPVNDRLDGSLAAAAAGVLCGANILRVHDVGETRRFITVLSRILGADQS